MRYLLLTLLTFAMLTGTAEAGKRCMHHASGHQYNVSEFKNPSSREYAQAFNRMHKDMAIRYSGDPDTDFVRGMIPHHQGAVDMAEALLKHGNDEKLRALGHWIIKMQKQEIAFMKRWLERRGLPEPASDSATTGRGGKYRALAREADATMHRDMMIDFSSNADEDFARGMIPHHQGAIDMALALQKHGQDSELQALASDIIRSQRQEIARMKCWLKRQGK